MVIDSIDKDYKTIQKFGGKWTKEKLNIFSDYLNAYIIALQNQKFKKIYIDAFAGTGEIETSDGNLLLDGSAKRALDAEQKFDHYYFIENNKIKAEELQRMIDSKFNSMKDNITIYCGDANNELIKIITNIDWRYNRGLLFLDPYATQVDWKTLEKVASTKSIDVWYLFPMLALNRMLRKNGECENNENCLIRLLGDDSWKREFYMEDPQVGLFDDEFENTDARLIKVANTEKIKKYLIKRLRTIFPCVSQYPRLFKNTKNSALFLFCFAISNNSKAAQKLALKIANYILKNK